MISVCPATLHSRTATSRCTSGKAISQIGTSPAWTPVSGRTSGQRLKAVEKYVKDEEYFLANYADALTDLHLPDEIERLKQSGKIGCFVCAKPFQFFSVVSVGKEGSVDKIDFVRDTDLMINGGYFVFRKDIFEYINEGEELVAEPFHSADAEEPAPRLSVRQILVLHGHLQGTAGVERYV